MRPFGCPVTILNTIDHLGKFDGKADEEFFVRYYTNSKAFKVFNSRTKIVEENLHVKFSENSPNIAGSGRNWLFDIDALTKSMNYKPVVAGHKSNSSTGTKACDSIGKARLETVSDTDYILLPLWTQDSLFFSSSKDTHGAGFKPSGDEEKKDAEDPGNENSEILSTEEPRVNQENDVNVNSTNNINTVSRADNVAGIDDKAVNENIVYGCADNLNIPDLEEIGRFGDDEDDDSGADMNNLDTYFQDEKGIVIKNKARLVTQGYTQEDGINYDEVFAPVARIEEIRLFLAYASFKDFVYQMDVKSDFLYGKIEEEVYVCQPPGFEDPDFPDRVYEVEKALYGLHQEPRAWYETLLNYLLDNEFQRGMIGKTLFIKRDKSDILLVQVYVDDIIFGSTREEMRTEFELTFFLGLQVKHKKNEIFISQDKYVHEILNKLGFSNVIKASTPMETHKTLLKDEKGEDVDEHLYRSMIGSLMYLTSSRPGLWYPKDSPFDLVAYTNSDYAGASLDRKSTTGGYKMVDVNAPSGQAPAMAPPGLYCFLHHSINLHPAVLGYDTNDKKAESYRCQLDEQWFVLTKDTLREALQITPINNNQAFVAPPSSDMLVDFVNESGYPKLVRNMSNVATAKVKNINGEAQLHAKVDRKKVVISKASIRRDLQFGDEGGIDCLPNETIFEQLLLMSAKTTAWNKFSSTITSAVICLAIEQKFNFFKYIFDNMVENLDSATKFLMFPRFVQVFLNNQLEEMANHTRIYVPPSHTKKIFGNMKRVGKSFFKRDTPLFLTMMVQAQKELGEDIAIPAKIHPTPIITQPSSSSQPSRKQKPKKTRRQNIELPQTSVLIETVVDKDLNEENVPTQSNDPPLPRVNTLQSGEDILKLNELMELYTKLFNRVLNLETTKTAQAKEISSLKRRVMRLEKKRRGWMRISNIDANQDIYLVNVHKDKDIFGVNDQDNTLMFDADKDLQGEEVVVEEVDAVSIATSVTATATTVVSFDELAMAQVLVKIKTSRPKAKGIIMQEPNEAPTTTTIPLPSKV
nr:putative ribonuclease H-like domain-containing protein [Tanacetum cinerariifolium]